MSQNPINIVLLSKSDVKTVACIQFAEYFLGKGTTVECVNIPDTPDRPEQPIGQEETWNASSIRIDTYYKGGFMKESHTKQDTVIVAIENGIEEDKETGIWYDICAVNAVLAHSDEPAPMTFSKIKVLIEPKWMDTYWKYVNDNMEKTGRMKMITFGDYIMNPHRQRSNTAKNNWMNYLGGIDRKSQIIDGLTEAIVKSGLLRKQPQSALYVTPPAKSKLVVSAV